MGIMEKIKGLFGQHEEKVDDAVDEVADLADDKTGGKHGDKIDTAADKAHEVVDDLGDIDAK